MTKKNFFGSFIVLLSVLILTLLVLVISHTMVAERLENHLTSIPEEQRLNMVEGAVSLVLPENVELADGITWVSEALDEKGEHLAYVMDALFDGADGDVVVRVVLDEEGCISAIKVLETAGQPTNLGYMAASGEYLDQYIGASEITSDWRSVSGTLIKSIDGADYSCQGVYSCVKSAFAQLKLMEENKEAENGQ